MTIKINVLKVHITPKTITVPDKEIRKMKRWGWTPIKIRQFIEKKYFEEAVQNTPPLRHKNHQLDCDTWVYPTWNFKREKSKAVELAIEGIL